MKRNGIGNLKRIIKISTMIIGLLFVALLCFTGCGSTDDRIEVVVWHSWDVEEGGTEHELKVIVDEYNASQNEIKVVLQAQPTSGYSDKVYNAVANGVGPDIIMEFATVLPEYEEGSFLADMGKYIDIEKLSSRLPQALMEESVGTADGKLHIVPIHNTIPVLFYNKTLYDELGLNVPTTWDEVAANSKKIYEEKGIAGFATDSYIDLGQTLFMETGSTYIDTETLTVGFNNDACAEQIEWFSENAKNNYFATTFTTGSIDGDFNAGLIGSFFGTSSYEPYITPNGFEYATAPVPTLDGNGWAPIFNRGIIVFASDEETENAACDFVEYFTNIENSSRWCRSIGAISPYKDVQEQEEFADYLANDSVLQASIKTMEYGGTLPPVKGARAIRNEIKQAFAQVIGGLKTAKEALKEAETNSNKALLGQQ